MIGFYPQIKWVHVAAVLFSGGLFAMRGLAMLAGARWFMAAPLRYLSYTVDTVLLTAALMLATLLHQYPFVHGWLTAKVLLLVVYVVLGSYALKRGATRVVRAWSFVAALLVYGFIISIARSHDPRGLFALLGCSFPARMGPWAHSLPRCAAVLYVYTYGLICIKVPAAAAR